MTTTSIAPKWHAAVEQARARGLTVEETVVELNVHPRLVLAVWAAMDAAAVEDDLPLRDHYAMRRDMRAVRCGTLAGYEIHRRNGEPIDAECRAFRARYDHDRYLRRRAS